MFLKVQKNQLPKYEEYTKKQNLSLKNGRKEVEEVTIGQDATSGKGTTSEQCAEVEIVEAVDV